MEVIFGAHMPAPPKGDGMSWCIKCPLLYRQYITHVILYLHLKHGGTWVVQTEPPIIEQRILLRDSPESLQAMTSAVTKTDWALRV